VGKGKRSEFEPGFKNPAGRGWRKPASVNKKGRGSKKRHLPSNERKAIKVLGEENRKTRKRVNNLPARTSQTSGARND